MGNGEKSTILAIDTDELRARANEAADMSVSDRTGWVTAPGFGGYKPILWHTAFVNPDHLTAIAEEIDRLRADLRSATNSYRGALDELGKALGQLEEAQFSMECCGKHGATGP